MRIDVIARRFGFDVSNLQSLRYTYIMYGCFPRVRRKATLSRRISYLELDYGSSTKCQKDTEIGMLNSSNDAVTLTDSSWPRPRPLLLLLWGPLWWLHQCLCSLQSLTHFYHLANSVRRAESALAALALEVLVIGGFANLLAVGKHREDVVGEKSRFGRMPIPILCTVLVRWVLRGTMSS